MVNNIADDWIRTVDLWRRKQPLYKLRHCLSNVQVRMGVTKRSRTRSLRFIFLIATPSSQRVKPNRRNVEIVMNFAIGKKRVTVLAKPNVRPEPCTQVP